MAAMTTAIRSRARPARRSSPPRSEFRALVWGIAALALTSIHHVYGAVRYDTPERYHAVLIAAVALGFVLFGYALSRTSSSPGLAGAGRWMWWIVNAAVAGLLFGAVEGFFNHVVKVALYFGGMSEDRLRWLFRDPLFELPNDVFFEATGVLQVVPSALVVYYVVCAFEDRRRARAARGPAATAAAGQRGGGPQ